MTSRWDRPTSTGAAAAVWILLPLTIVGLIVFSYVTAPKPESRVDELASNYRVNRDRFRTIATLASVEATFGIDVATGSLGADHITSKDVPRYLDVLAALSAIGAEHVSASDHALDVTTASEGLAVSGRESGYYFTTASDVETVTLEIARSADAPEWWLYPLGDGWYASDYRF